MRRAAHKGEPDMDPTGPRMPALLRAAGFDVDGGKVHIGAGTRVFSGLESRKWLAWRAAGQLGPGEPLRRAWIEVGITEDEIQQTLCALPKWARRRMPGSSRCSVRCLHGTRSRIPVSESTERRREGESCQEHRAYYDSASRKIDSCGSRF